ncbi:MAG: SDR family oxidoreductase [Actinomycetota bacterium]|nr:SDR family oxidoreductase [Actinomycetota bacterium]
MNSNSLTQSLDLTGKVAIITGGSRGIGRSIAIGFAQNGANVVVTSRNLETCESTVEEIHKLGGSAVPISAHMGRLQEIKSLVDQTIEAYGTVDIIVNNAANPLMLGVGEITEEAWEKALNTNLRGPVFLVQEALPHLESGSGGSVINMLSNAAFMYSANHLLYTVAKSGLDAATRSMAAQLASKNIRVNAMVPGTVDTDMVQAMPESFQEMAAKGSLLRRAAHPDEMVAMAIVLASDAGSFMTGHTYFVDGGQSYR